jgi:peptide deformylase
MRKIVTYPNKVLRVKTREIRMVDKELISDIEDLKDVLKSETAHAAGLAAVQIGIEKRFFGLLIGEKKEMMVFINPRIERVYGDRVKPMMTFDDGKQEEFLEGCLSFPNLFGTVKRYLKIEVSWDEIFQNKLKRQRAVFNGIEAIAFQHEGEHLDGILFVDYIKKEGGELYKFEGEKKMKLEIDKIIKN